eukprot:Amastigsp_a534387_2.p2 type:complete len:118 gc:universal Amastigsp_a534387_2:151-504(+)
MPGARVILTRLIRCHRTSTRAISRHQPSQSTNRLARPWSSYSRTRMRMFRRQARLLLLCTKSSSVCRRKCQTRHRGKWLRAKRKLQAWSMACFRRSKVSRSLPRRFQPRLRNALNPM